MPAPVLKSFAQRIYDSVGPLAYDDVGQGFDLANYCAALGEMFQVVDDYSRDQLVAGKLADGWSQLLDVNRTPTEALAWLAQFVGVTLGSGLTDAQQRATIRQVGGWNRGTVAALIAAAQATLTGAKTVTLVERNGGAYALTVITKAAETPSPTLTQAALLAQIPAGIILTYQNIDGQLYSDLLVNEPTYALAFTNYVTYQDLLLNIPTIPAGGNVTFGGGTFGAGKIGGGA